ncbi:hypothetical protein, partial [Clostridium perfringens]
NVLAADIDASGTVNWSAGRGFQPIGKSTAEPFTGSLNGQFHTVNGLTINRPTDNEIGFIGNLGSPGKISNIGLVETFIIG